MKKTLGLICLLLVTQSCATLFGDSSDEITFTSEPEGASVYLQGNKIGTTPLQHTFDRETFVHYQIQIKKEGYKTKAFKVNKTLNKIAILNLTSILSWGTDALSGNMIEYAPKKYLIELEKKGTVSNEDRPSALLFAFGNQENLLNDISRGEGEYLTTFLELKSIPVAKRGIVRTALKEDLQLLSSSESRRDFYNRMTLVVNETL